MDNSLMKLGKNAPKFNHKTLPMAKYLKGLPPIPQSFSHANPAFNYPMMKNDSVGCHDAHTEVLTVKGWQPWPEYNGDLLGTMNQVTGFLEFQAPTVLTRAEYDGPMYYAEHKSLDFALTPEHRILHRPYIISNGRQYIKGTAGYGERQFRPISGVSSRIALPATTTGFLGVRLNSIRIGTRDWNGDDLIAILALVLSDGWVGGTDSNWSTVSFCCFREDRYDMVASLAFRLGIGEQPNRKGVWKFSDLGLAAWIRKNCYVGTEYESPFKRIPDLLKCINSEQVVHFLKYFGDQHVNDGGRRQFYSSSQKMIDDLQDLLLRIGRRGGIYSRPQRSSSLIKATEGHFDITLTEWQERETGITLQGRRGSKKAIQVDHYKGEVFCATVPNSTLITRRNGQILVSGNCCTVAAAGHMIQTWTRLNGNEVLVPDSEIITAYSAVTGIEGGAYDPATGANDNGCAITDVLNYWQTSGINGHRIDGWVGVDITKRDQVLAAIYLFAGVDIGLGLPITAQRQSTWDVVGDGQTGDSAPGSWGGHSVPILGFAPTYDSLITWAQLIHMTLAFWTDYVDEAYVPLSQDWASKVKGSPDHFDYASLEADLQMVKAA